MGYERSLASVMQSSLMYSIHESSQSSTSGSNTNDSTVVILVK